MLTPRRDEWISTRPRLELATQLAMCFAIDKAKILRRCLDVHSMGWRLGAKVEVQQNNDELVDRGLQACSYYNNGSETSDIEASTERIVVCIESASA